MIQLLRVIFRSTGGVKLFSWNPTEQAGGKDKKIPNCDGADLTRPAKENFKIFYPDRMNFGGKKLRRKSKSSKKSHRKSSKKSHSKSRRARKSRRGRR